LIQVWSQQANKKPTPKNQHTVEKELFFFRECVFLSFIFVLLFIIQIQLQCQKMADMSLETMHAIGDYFNQQNISSNTFEKTEPAVY